jgi:isopenicillin-N epimerase
VDIVAKQMPVHCRYAVFDHITSNTALLLPVPRLIQLCRQRGVRVLIDGAHALGQIPVHLDEWQPDYYVTNCHKWFSNPKGVPCQARMRGALMHFGKGCAVLYVADALQESVQPVVVSHGHGNGFLSSFIWSGLMDYTCWTAMYTTLDWWQQEGADRVRSANHTLCLSAGRREMRDRTDQH